MAASAAYLRLENISKSLGRTRALDGLTFEIDQGGFLTLLGPSGSGKTTTMRIIAGLVRPDQGVVYLANRCLDSAEQGTHVPTEARNMGLVFQSYAIWPHMNVFDNVAYPLKVRRVHGPDIRRRVHAILETVGLRGYEKRGSTTLSGGEQQRVAFARALVHEPDVLLLDEPFSNLDTRLRGDMRNGLRSLLAAMERPITTVFVTHDQEEALLLSDTIGVLDHGVLHQVGSPRDLYLRPASAFVRDFIGDSVKFPGTVEAVAGTRITVRAASNSAAQVAGRAGGAVAPGVGSPVLVSIRPENVRLTAGSREGSSSNVMQGSVIECIFVGPELDCRIRLSPGTDLRMRAPSASGLAAGSDVLLSFQEDDVTVWPA